MITGVISVFAVWDGYGGKNEAEGQPDTASWWVMKQTIPETKSLAN